MTMTGFLVMYVVVMVVTVSAVVLVGVPVPMFVAFAATAAVRDSSRGGDAGLDFRYAVGLLGRAGGGPADGSSGRQVGRLATQQS